MGGNIGIMEKTMETTVVYWGNIGCVKIRAPYVFEGSHFEGVYSWGRCSGPVFCDVASRERASHSPLVVGLAVYWDVFST